MVGALLTKHVLRNYDKFVRGIEDVAALEEELKATYQSVKVARGLLRSTREDFGISLRIAKDTASRQRGSQVLDALTSLQQIRDLDAALK